jgi:hypothetical protein
VTDRLWDVALLLAGVAFAALGIVNPATAPWWVALATASLVAAFARWQRGWVGEQLVRLGIHLGGAETLERFLPAAPDPSIAEARREARSSIRVVTEALTEAMVRAEEDRERGKTEAQIAAIAAANRASSIVHEIQDEDARELVGEWKALFDAIPKGWKKRGQYDEHRPLGYPDANWQALKDAAYTAQDQLGALLRRE